MVICTVEVNEKSPQTIVIGRRGTYNTQEIVFDIGYLIDAYGAGTAVLAIKRSQDSSAYPTVVTQEDNTLTWTVSETDTYYVGAGECQLMWYVDGGLAKTIIYPLVVMRDILSTSEEAPDAYQEWVDNLTALGAETLQNARGAAQSASDAESAKDDAVTAKEAAEEAAETAQEAVVHAPIIQNGYWYIWNNGQYVNTNVRAEGQKGDKGDTGEKGDTGNGITSITKTGTAGLVDTYTVTYTDGTTTTFTVTNGAKGDKGDAGATGNGIDSITKTGTSGNVDTYTITYTNGQTTTFTVTNGAVASVAGKTGAVTLDAGDVSFDGTQAYPAGSIGAEVSDAKNAIDRKAPLIINTASGDVASFADGADGMPIKKIVGTIVPVQSGTGNPSPDNVRLISGRTGANAKNARNILLAYEPLTFSTAGKAIYAAGPSATGAVVVTSGDICAVENYIECSQYRGKQLSINYRPVGTSQAGGIAFYNANKSFLQNGISNSSTTGGAFTFTVPNSQDVVYLRLSVQYTKREEIMMWVEEEAQTLPINWQTEAGTIYGGTITLYENESVDVVADFAKRTITSISGSFGATNKGYAYYITLAGTNHTVPYEKQGNMRSNLFLYYPSSRADAPLYSYGGKDGADTTLFFILPSTITTVADANAWFASNPTDIIVYLATPQTYHIDNIGKLYTYLGTNNVWIDTGTITECDYPADTKLYIDGLTAPDEDMIADGLIASGKYFTVNNQLYLSTAQIAAGAQIIPGSNCTATNIVEALNALNT